MHVSLAQRTAGFSSDFNIINNLNGPGGPGHTGGRAFMLWDGGGSLPSHHAMLHMEAKTILADFRFGQFGVNGGFELRVVYSVIRRRGRFGRRGGHGR